jgi:hypothetical protein
MLLGSDPAVLLIVAVLLAGYEMILVKPLGIGMLASLD